MEALGKIGNFYIVLLFVLLLAGLGILSVKFSRKVWSSTESLLDKTGSKSINKWLKFAVASFAGLIIASFALGLTNSVWPGSDSSMGGMGGSSGMMGGSSGIMGSSTGGSGGASSQDHTAHHPGGQQGGTDAPAAQVSGYAQDTNNNSTSTVINSMGYGTGYGSGYGMGNDMEAQMYMMQTQLQQLQQLQQQLSYMMHMNNQQGYYPVPMGNSSQSSSGSNSGGGMGMM